MKQLLRNIAQRILPQRQQDQFQSAARKLRFAYIKRFKGYRYEHLLDALSTLGIKPGDVVMVHAGFAPANGFQESPARVVAAIIESVGPAGTVLMPSTPYVTTTDQYVRCGLTYSVKTSSSQMGILSEIFRRHRSAVRSLHPAHPVAALGPLAASLVEGHELCLYSCGSGSPYEKLVKTEAKILFFDVPLSTMTFFHYLEHIVNPDLPFPLYVDQPSSVRVLDENGVELYVPVRPFSPEAQQRKCFGILETELRRREVVRETRVGNTQLRLLNASDALTTTLDMARRGIFFYE